MGLGGLFRSCFGGSRGRGAAPPPSVRKSAVQSANAQVRPRLDLLRRNELQMPLAGVCTFVRS